MLTTSSGGPNSRIHLSLDCCVSDHDVCDCCGQRQSHRGRDLNPRLDTNAQAITKWQDARVGLSIHWGPVALRGTEISWSRGTEASWARGAAGQVPQAEYDKLYKEFNPTLFDAKEWVQLFKNSGFRYITVVTKHVDSFSMWSTKQSDYNIMNTPFHRDWLREISDECHRQGIMFGTYYSIGDWYQHDYGLGGAYRPAGPGFKLDRAPDFERYVDYVKKQLKELIVNYGSEIIRDTPPLWMWNPGPYWNYTKYAGDYQEREDYIGGPARYPWEAWIILGTQWAWKANDKYKSAEDVIRYLVVTVGGGGNFNLNVTPMLDGRFEQRQKDTLLKIGAFLKANGESIYGTRRGPFEPGLWGASTQRADKVYVHVLAWPAESLRLFPLDRKVKSAQLLHGGEVRWKQLPEGIELSLPQSKRNPLDTIVELTVE